MRTHAHHWQVPYVHLHSPHLDWHEVGHPGRAALAAAAAMAVLVSVGMLASKLPPIPPPSTWSVLPQATAPTMTPDLPREWRWERKAITFDHMYRSGAAEPGIAHMYAKPRPR